MCSRACARHPLFFYKQLIATHPKIKNRKIDAKPPIFVNMELDFFQLKRVTKKAPSAS